MIQYWMDWLSGIKVLMMELQALRELVNIQKGRIDALEKRLTDQGI